MYGLPGPTMAGTAGMVSVPTAKAAIPATPLQRKIRSIPNRSQATSSAGSSRPSARGGASTAIAVTPATRPGAPVATRADGDAPCEGRLPRQVHAVPAPIVLQQRVITPRLHVLDRAARTL